MRDRKTEICRARVLLGTLALAFVLPALWLFYHRLASLEPASWAVVIAVALMTVGVLFLRFRSRQWGEAMLLLQAYSRLEAARDIRELEDELQRRD